MSLLFNSLTSLPSINPSTISQICNIVFVIIIAIILLGGVIGMLRGVWSASFRLIFVGLLVILSYIFAGQIGDAVAEIDLTQFFHNSIDVSGQTVEITSLKDTIRNIIAAISASANDVNIQTILSNPRTLEMVNGLAMIVIRLVTFILLAIIIIIFGNLLATILYHVLFKHLISKEFRKKVKLRVVGFFEGMVKSTLVVSMLIIPFSAILNTASKAFSQHRPDDLNEIDNETYRQLSEWIEAYDNSFLAQALFNWSKGKDQNTWDMYLVDSITSTKDSTYSFVNDIGTLASIAGTLFGSNSIGGDENGNFVINLSILLSGEIVSSLIGQITTSALIMDVLPLAAEFAINIDDVQTYIDKEKIDLDEINWEHDLKKLEEIYTDMLNSGVVDPDSFANPIDILNRMFNVNDETTHQKFIEIFEKFSDISLLNQVVPAAFYTLANTQMEDGSYNVLHDFLPSEWDDYQNISWGYELSTIYDSAYRFNKVVDNSLIKYVNSLQEEEEQSTNAMNEFLDNIYAHASGVSEILIGEKDSNGELLINPEDGKSATSQRCLLDSDLLSRSLNKLTAALISLLGDSLQDFELDTTIIEDAVRDLDTRLEYKQEFSAMFDVVTPIMEDENLRVVLKGESLILDEETCEKLKVPVKALDKSNVLLKVIPQFLKYFLETEETKEMLGEYGISIDSINYNVQSISNELSNILDVTPALNRISEAFKEETIENQIKKIEIDDLKTILTAVYKSDILNHKYDNQKQNFFLVIDYLFNNIGFEDNITDKIDYANIKWIGENSEIEHIGEFFKVFKEGNLVSLISEENIDYLDPNVLNPDSVEDLFVTVENSELLRASMGILLDNNLKDVLSQIGGSDKVSFTNIDNWSDEGANFAKLIRIMQELNKDGTTLENIDFLNSTATDEDGNLLTRNLVIALENSQLFNNSEDENTSNKFSDYLLEQLIANGAENIKLYDLNNPENYGNTKTFFANVSENDEWESEIDILFNFIKVLQDIGEKDAQAINNFGSAGLEYVGNNIFKYKELIVADGSADYRGVQDYIGLNSSEAFRMLIVNEIQSSLDIEFQSMELHLKERVNLQLLVNMDDVEARNAELSDILDMLDNISTIQNSDFEDIKANKNNELEVLKTALLDLHNSKIFNSVNENNVIDGNTKLTAFEGLISEVIKAGGIDENAMIGKINDNIDLKYNSIKEVVLSIPNNRCDEEKEDGWIDQNDSNDGKGEISKIINLVKDLGNNNFDDGIQYLDNIELILPQLNNSKLLYRSLPYFINQFCKNADVTDFGNLDLTVAKPEYTFDINEKDYAPYEEEEITRLSTIISDFDSLRNIASEGFTLSSIKDRENRSIIEEILKSLSKSRIFHVDVNNSGETGTTVFLQLIEEILDKSTLKEAIYDETIYSAYYSEKGILNADENVKQQVTDYNYDCIHSDDKNWDSEIDNILAIFDKVIAMTDTNKDVDGINNININQMSPDQIAETLETINNSNLAYHAVPVFMKEAFSNINMNEFSKNQEHYIIGDSLQKSKENYRDYEIDNLRKILNGMCTVTYDDNDQVTNVEYVKFDEEFQMSTLAENKNNPITEIIRFLTNSYIFKDCRGIVLSNSVQSIGFVDNIRTEYDEYRDGSLIHNVFDEIFVKIEESSDKEAQIDLEGATLCKIINGLQGLIESNKKMESENSLLNIDSQTIQQIFKDCYSHEGDDGQIIYQKALISCEVLSAFVSDAITQSGYLDDDYMNTSKDDATEEWINQWYKASSGEDFEYPLYNDLESNSITAVIECIKTIHTIKVELVGGMPKVEGLNDETLSKLESLFENLHDEENQSFIARSIYEKGIYASLMIENPGFLTTVHNNNQIFMLNQSAKTKFETHYELMMGYDNAQADNFNFGDIDIAVSSMIEAILEVIVGSY